MRRSNYNNQLMVNKRRKEDLKLMRMYKLKFAIWEMVAGLIITSLQRFRPDSTDLQRLLSEQIITLPQMFGALHVPSSKWLLEISFLNLEKAIIMIRMMIILHR
jgi:hypothetical protein